MHKGPPVIDGSLIRMLALCGRNSSFRTVARLLNTHQSTVTRQMDKLESQLGYRVVHRGPEGFTLTDAGSALIVRAQDVERAIQSFMRDAEAYGVTGADTITVQAPEGLGTFWITRQYAQTTSMPHTRLNLICSDILPEFREPGIDISIQYAPAFSEDCIQQTLGHLQIIPFASRNFLDTHGKPDTLHDLRNFRIVSQVGPHEVEDLWFDQLPPQDLKSVSESIYMRTNSGSAHYFAIANSYGIGSLPTYGPQVDPNLVPLDLGVSQLLPIYAVYKPEAREKPAFSETLDWLRSIFDPKTHPYFSRRLTT